MKNQDTLRLVISTAQLAALIIGLSGLAISIGRRDSELTNATTDIAALESISSDLLRASIETSSATIFHMERINELRDRLAVVELRIGSRGES